MTSAAPLRERAADAADAAIARELVAFALETEAAGAVQVGGAFTDIAEADALVKRSPEAFLLAVLFTQGIPAERAWAGPWSLSERLGHLDLRRLAGERAAVDAAMCARPALHRFKHTVAGWVSDAAALLLERYDGDASRIWSDGAGAIEVTERLSAFPGIGRKKAAMAVELLARHFGAPIADMECGTVAYDVHVRRVFLRTGLIDVDTPAAVCAAAGRAYPVAPGRIDLPVWLIGRQWCHPRRPECGACRLGGVCRRLTGRSVEGVGARKR